MLSPWRLFKPLMLMFLSAFQERWKWLLTVCLVPSCLAPSWRWICFFPRIIPQRLRKTHTLQPNLELCNNNTINTHIYFLHRTAAYGLDCRNAETVEKAQAEACLYCRGGGGVHTFTSFQGSQARGLWMGSWSGYAVFPPFRISYGNKAYSAEYSLVHNSSFLSTAFYLKNQLRK